jgi:DNA invertase Pin-like site-specific DNA recombinase
VRSPEHEVTTLYVFEISRVSRSLIEMLDVVRGLEEECGIIVWSLSAKEAWTKTTDRSIRNLMLAIFSWVVERECENLSERTMPGWHERAVRGNISAGLSGRSNGERLMSIGQRDYRGRPFQG